jgi:hypothetical protein
LVGAFNKAYVPKEWARTYRGALSNRKQREGESLLKYAAALRDLALTAYPSTVEDNTDKIREERCLDQFLRGIRDSLLAVFVSNSNPDTMEDAISAAEGYSAILAKDETDLPDHPDKRPVVETSAMSSFVVSSAADSKQPRAKQSGQKSFAKKQKKAKEAAREPWDNNNSKTEWLIKAFEELCSRSMKGYRPNSQQTSNFTRPRPNTDQKGYKKPAEQRSTQYKREEYKPKCYKCQRLGHIRRDCVFAAEEEALAVWFCEEHVPADEGFDLEEGFH